MPDITVTKINDSAFRVEVTEGKRKTTHQVTATPDVIQRYGEGVSPELLIKASFEFLLEREPQESILSTFELPVIERYFPEYPQEIREVIERDKKG